MYIAQRRQSLREIVTAVAAVHSAGWVHLDIRGTNVAFVAGSGWQLLDFDASIRIGDPLSMTPCTPPFCAPEIASAIDSETFYAKTASPALDMWSVGAMLIEVCSEQDLNKNFGLRPVGRLVVDLGALKPFIDRALEVDSVCSNVALDCLIVDPTLRLTALEVLSRLQ